MLTKKDQDKSKTVFSYIFRKLFGVFNRLPLMSLRLGQTET